MEIIIRKGVEADLEQVFNLVKELAEYERAANEVENSVDDMRKDGFGPNPIFGMIVAEDAGKIIGIAVYYYRYSTWKGKRLYLEDIIVTESYRWQGIGKMLFEAAMKQSLESDCNGMTWLVLDWNTPAISFYKKYNASFEPEWTVGSLSRKQLEDFIATKEEL
ncbi:MAG: GNAT family N-acetyltransferase [Cytophagales bacterium]|nr:GNAT family N-acetyltransferase [Cytophagales bacterium]